MKEFRRSAIKGADSRVKLAHTDKETLKEVLYTLSSAFVVFLVTRRLFFILQTKLTSVFPQAFRQFFKCGAKSLTPEQKSAVSNTPAHHFARTFPSVP